MNGFLNLPFNKNFEALNGWDESYIDLSTSLSQCRDWHGGDHCYLLEEGVDYQIPIGTPIFASAPGVILSAEDNWEEQTELSSSAMFEAGNRVIIDHFPGQQSGYRTGYYHLSEIAVKFRKMQFPINNADPSLQFVERGELIGYSGNTGHGTTVSGSNIDPQLHFQVNKYPLSPVSESDLGTFSGPIWFGGAGGEIVDPYRDLAPNSSPGSNAASSKFSLWTKDNDPVPSFPVGTNF
jgi:murein DD-endopeptidase MepM/ murein hydrolase activator NlpD